MIQSATIQFLYDTVSYTYKFYSLQSASYTDLTGYSQLHIQNLHDIISSTYKMYMIQSATYTNFTWYSQLHIHMIQSTTRYSQ